MFLHEIGNALEDIQIHGIVVPEYERLGPIIAGVLPTQKCGNE
jgi:hypothetical protein